MGLPFKLTQALEVRYEKLGGKYATDKVHEESGLFVNSCMEKDNLQDLWEELVDAVFNCLVFIYRNPKGSSGYAILKYLLAACSALEIERKSRE